MFFSSVPPLPLLCDHETRTFTIPLDLLQKSISSCTQFPTTHYNFLFFELKAHTWPHIWPITELDRSDITTPGQTCQAGLQQQAETATNEIPNDINLSYGATAVVSVKERSGLRQGQSGHVSISCNTQIQHISLTISHRTVILNMMYCHCQWPWVTLEPSVLHSLEWETQSFTALAATHFSHCTVYHKRQFFQRETS